MFGKHAKTEAEVAEEGIEPNGGLDILAGLTEPERVAELAAGEQLGFAAGHAAAREIVSALIEVKFEFVLEISGSPSGAEGIDDTGNPRHGKLLVQAWLKTCRSADFKHPAGHNQISQ
jgi:hypothetical protein